MTIDVLPFSAEAITDKVLPALPSPETSEKDSGVVISALIGKFSAVIFAL
jgi:hypothetical protein